MNCCAWTQAAAVFALPVVSMLMLKLPTRDNMESAAHNSVCDTKWLQARLQGVLITRARLEATI